MRLRILKLDHNGYNGREHFALDSDEGSTVLVLGLTVDQYDGEGDYIGPALDGGIAAHPLGLTEYEDRVEYCWTCVTEDGRTVELMDHEVEVVAK